jgi:hypothetical protein
MAYRIITLFTAPPPPRRGHSSFGFSVLAHGVAFGILSVVPRHTTHIIDDWQINEQHTVRLVEVHSPESQARSSVGSGIMYPGSHAGTDAAQPGRPAAAPASVPRELAQLVSAPQTLVQPDLPPDVVLPPDTPIPAALMWSAGSSQLKKIIPPPQQEAATGDVPPSLETPNHEINLADLEMTGTSFATLAPALPPSTTSPLVVRGHPPVQRVPEMASSPSGAPTPARVISVSDLQLRDGIIALPPANESAPPTPSEALVAGHGENSQGADNGDAAGKQTRAGAGQGTGDKADKDAGNNAANKKENGTTAIGSAGKNDANIGASTASGAISGSGASNSSSVDRINLPKNGRFGVTVVGSSLAEAYPETIGVWGSRLAYTVYVHAGLARTWILQYSVPRSTEAVSAGDIARPDAPWPFYIVVPHIALDKLNADAILVHGFVTAGGRFEQLAIVSPPEFGQREFVLNALQEWKFRPAIQNGQVTTVEVLLIIPEAPD